MAFVLNNDYELTVFYEAMRLGNAIHAEADKVKKTCVNVRAHAVGLALQERARILLGVSASGISPDILKGLM